MKARSPSLIDRRVLDPLLVRTGVLPRSTPLPESRPGDEPVRFAESPPQAPKDVAQAPKDVAEVRDDTPDVADVDTAPDQPVEASDFGSPPVIRTQAPEPVPQALDISTLMSEWKYPGIVIEAPDTGSEYPDVVMEAPDDDSPEYPDVVMEAPDAGPEYSDVLPKAPEPGDEPLERRLADLLSWAIDSTGATAAFVADESGLPLANRESPEALIAAAPLVGQSLEGMATLVPSPALRSAAIELENHNALQLIWVDAGSGRLTIGLVLADALASARIRTVRAALERAVST